MDAKVTVETDRLRLLRRNSVRLDARCRNMKVECAPRFDWVRSVFREEVTARELLIELNRVIGAVDCLEVFSEEYGVEVPNSFVGEFRE